MQLQETPVDSHPITPELVSAVQAAVAAKDQRQLLSLLETLHEADTADLLEQLGPEQRHGVVALWGKEFDSEVLSELDEPVQAEIVAQLPPEQLEKAGRELVSDDVVDLIADLEADQRRAVLAGLDDVERAAVEQSLGYPENSAGRLMQREIVIVPQHWNVGQTIDFLRSSPDLPVQFYHLLLTDPKAQLVGMVALGRLMASKRLVSLIDIADADCRPIRATESQQDVAYAFNQYHLISAPVLDANGRVAGVITIDDAMAVLEDEAEEDLMRLSGVGDESLSRRVTETARQRFPWLFVNLATAIVASLVIDRFSHTIEALVALAVLMPIVASMGGNAGTQSLAVAVRALATRDLTRSNALRVVRRETLVGLMNGLLFAVIAGTVGLIWFGMPMLGAVMGLAMIITMLAAGLAGILIPIGFDRVGVDPALASGVFVTTVTDVVGFLAFLGLAAVIFL